MTSKAHSHTVVSETVSPLPMSEGWDKVTQVVDVTVQHRDTDSFSRSVDRAARRYVESGAMGPVHVITMIDGSRYAAETQFAARDPRPWIISFVRFEVTRTRRRQQP